MRVEGAKRLRHQLNRLPDEVQAEVAKVVRRNTESGARLARRLVPVKTGELKGWIYTKYDWGGMRGSVEAAPETKEAQTKARAVEFGRNNARTAAGTRTKKIASTGRTAASPYMRIMQRHLGKRFRSSIKAAIRKAARRTVSSG